MKRYVLESVTLVSLLTITQVTLASDPATGSQPSKNDQTLWNLEHAYWRYVEENDLAIQVTGDIAVNQPDWNLARPQSADRPPLEL